MEQTSPRPIRIRVRRGSAAPGQQSAFATYEAGLQTEPRPDLPNPDLAHRGWTLVASRAGARVYRRSSVRSSQVIAA